MGLSIEPISTQYLPQIRAIEHQAHTHPWSDQHLNDIEARFACHHLLLKDGEVLGYYYAQNIGGEMTLLNIAIVPQQQGNGYGDLLLKHLIEYGQQSAAESIWLEVRESNHRAINLYTSLEFNEVTRRMDYYPCANGREDAIVMSYTL